MSDKDNLRYERFTRAIDLLSKALAEDKEYRRSQHKEVTRILNACGLIDDALDVLNTLVHRDLVPNFARTMNLSEDDTIAHAKAMGTLQYRLALKHLQNFKDTGNNEND